MNLAPSIVKALRPSLLFCFCFFCFVYTKDILKANIFNFGYLSANHGRPLLPQANESYDAGNVLLSTISGMKDPLFNINKGQHGAESHLGIISVPLLYLLLNA